MGQDCGRDRFVRGVAIQPRLPPLLLAILLLRPSGTGGTNSLRKKSPNSPGRSSVTQGPPRGPPPAVPPLPLHSRSRPRQESPMSHAPFVSRRALAGWLPRFDDRGRSQLPIVSPTLKRCNESDDFHRPPRSQIRIAARIRRSQIEGRQTGLTAENQSPEAYLKAIPEREASAKRLTDWWNYEKVPLPCRRDANFFTAQRCSPESGRPALS